MTNRARVTWLLAVLILAGLGWWLWPGDPGSPEPVDAIDRERGEQPTEQDRRESSRDLALETKSSVSGTVRTFGGGPIANAQVCATSVRAELRGHDDGKPRCTRTGPDGHYRLEGLWPVRTQFSASAAAHEPKAWRTRDARGRWREHATLEPGRETKGIDFELPGGGVRLSGVVKDLGGGEIEGALIEARSERPRSGGARATTVGFTDGDGRFEVWVAPGRTRVWASAEGYDTSATQALAPSERVELFLTPESVLIGQVVHAETGEPVPDVQVGTRARDFSGGNSAVVRSDGEGRFRIAGLGPGIYKPMAIDDHFYGQAAVQVHLGLGQTSEPIEVRVHPMALVEGRVVIAGSKIGCSDGFVELTRTDRGERASAETDDEGRVSLRGVRPGEYEVEVVCEDHVANDDYPNLVVASDDVLEQVWEVREGQAIRGWVVDSQGRPVSDARVSARMLVDVSNARAQTTEAWDGECEDDGSFTLAGLLPGRYELMALSELPAPDLPTTVELPVGADVNDVRIELLASGTITGRVIDEQGTGQPGVVVRARSIGKRDQTNSMTDDHGNFVIEHVRAGEARVEASMGGSPMRAPGSSDDEPGQQVEVLAGRSVEVELRVESRTGVITGKVFDEHGAPVDDAFIRAERLSESATADADRSRNAVRWGGGKPVLSEIDGNFTITELAPGNYTVRAHRRGGGEAIAESVPVGGSIELTIAPTGVLAGKVVVSGGQAPEKFRVSIADRSQGLEFGDEFFRTEGRWEISELPAGKFEINVSSNAGNAMLEVELASGGRREDLELILQSRVTIRGRVIDIDTREPVPGLEVSIASRGGGRSFSGSGKSGREEVSDAEGRFEVEHVPTGNVTILVASRSGGRGEYGWTQFPREIAAEPTVQDLGDLELVESRLEPDEVAGDLGFEPKQIEPDYDPDTVVLRVGLIRPGGPAAATEMAVGDVIETVDGKSVTGPGAWRYRQLTTVPPGTVVEFGLADGKSVSITAGPPVE